MECWGGIYGSEKRKESGEIGPAEKEYRDTEPAVCGVENFFFLGSLCFRYFSHFILGHTGRFDN